MRFSPPEKITAGEANYYLSRISNGQMAVDSKGLLHVCYGSGDIGTSPDEPAYVYYQNWTVYDGWSPRVSVDDSNVLEPGERQGEHIGGRHPSLALDVFDNLRVVWQDHRHCTRSDLYGWNLDNVEIYGDFRPAGGDFSDTDLRLTNSDADHMGDNGYLARVGMDRTVRAHVCWVDFNADGNIADIYMKTSDKQGVFNPDETMAEMRMTDFTGLGGSEFTVTVVDMAVTAEGKRHLVWAYGEFSDMGLYYAEVPDDADTITGELIAAGAADYQDPPHITLSGGEDVWIAYADESLGSLRERVVLLRRRVGGSSFEAPIHLDSPPARQTMPDLEVDPRGRVHLVWIDERSGSPEVYYALFDPETGEWSEERPLSPEPGSWVRPTLALDGDGTVHVLFEKKDSSFEPKGEIWFTTTAVDRRACAGRWNLFEDCL